MASSQRSKRTHEPAISELALFDIIWLDLFLEYFRWIKTLAFINNHKFFVGHSKLLSLLGKASQAPFGE
jgi:hypothetical protein